MFKNPIHLVGRGNFILGLEDIGDDGI